MEKGNDQTKKVELSLFKQPINPPLTKMNIEVEIRSFLSASQYQNLLSFFHQYGQLLKKDYQITYYFEGRQDLRIQQNNYYSKIWLKSGKMHDCQREELEIKFSREQFEDLVKLFQILGYKIKIQWLRHRHEFIWEGINVCLDNTKGYGFIIELEKISTARDQTLDLKILKEKLESLRIDLTPKAIFDQKFQEYQKNWRKLIKK